MATLPAANYTTDGARTEGEVKAALEAWLAATKQIPGAAQVELTNTISGGAITPAGGGGAVVIDTESAAATDDLTNIVVTNYPEGSWLAVRNANAARTVVLKHAATGSGQLLLARSASCDLTDTKQWVLLQRRGTDWVEVWRGPSRVTMPVVDKSATFTVTSEHHGMLVVFSSSGINANLSTAATLGDGFTVSMLNIANDDASVLVQPSGVELINGVNANVALYFGEGLTLVCSGGAFYTVGEYVKPRVKNVAFSSTITINVRETEYWEVLALTGNVTTFTISNPRAGLRLRVRFKQDATGGRTVATPSGAKITGSIDGTANKVSYLDLTYSQLDTRWEGSWSTVPV